MDGSLYGNGLRHERVKSNQWTGLHMIEASIMKVLEGKDCRIWEKPCVNWRFL